MQSERVNARARKSYRFMKKRPSPCGKSLFPVLLVDLESERQAFSRTLAAHLRAPPERSALLNFKVAVYVREGSA